jgi:hypothetical protein
MMLTISRGAPRAALLAALAAAFAAPAAAQQRSVEYEISFPNAVHHEAEVTATFRGVPAGAAAAGADEPLVARALRAARVRQERLRRARVRRLGRPLSVTRPNPHQWDVTGRDGTTVRVTYTLFGDRVDGTYAGIDAHPRAPEHARHLHVRAGDGRRAGPRHLPHPSRVARGHAAAAHGRLAVRPRPTSSTSWTRPPRWGRWRAHVDRCRRRGGPRTPWRMAVHHEGSDARWTRSRRWRRRWWPRRSRCGASRRTYDFGTYTFLADYVPWANGDGMEHRNSTIITSSRNITRPASGWGTWGPCRTSSSTPGTWSGCGPRSLEPFDFERENMSGELWFAEGFTSYYDALFMRRAGLYTTSVRPEHRGDVSRWSPRPGAGTSARWR